MKTLRSQPNLAQVPKLGRRRGQSIIEFALIVPVILALLIGILESAYLGKNYLAIANASREGARSASLGKMTTAIRTRVKNAATPLTLSDASIVLQYSLDNGATYPYTMGDTATQNNAPSGSLTRVTVNFTHQSLTRFFPFLSNRSISVPVAMRREAS